MLVSLASLLVFNVCQGIPESAEAPPASGTVPSGQAANMPAQPQAAQPAPVPSTGPNANPLDLFPQVLNYLMFFFSSFILVKLFGSWKCDHLVQGFPSMGSNAGGANTLDFLRNSPQVELYESVSLEQKR